MTGPVTVGGAFSSIATNDSGAGVSLWSEKGMIAEGIPKAQIEKFKIKLEKGKPMITSNGEIPCTLRSPSAVLSLAARWCTFSKMHPSASHWAKRSRPAGDLLSGYLDSFHST